MIEGKQCTVVWYVDDNKISHFGKMTVTRGREHVFLGMQIMNNDDGTATVGMKSYLLEAIAECGMNIDRTATTPATRTLFDEDPLSEPLSKTDAEVFHRIVAKLLYVAIRARADILLTVGFLCSRVAKSTTQDQDKLRRLLEYINGTIDLVHTIGADDLGKLQTWVDASYAVHPDMRSHTGGVMSFGTGGLLFKSTKQKLNSKS